jgi:transposase
MIDECPRNWERPGILALLRTRPDRLTELKKAKRDAFLTQNPAIQAIYQFQQYLHTLLMNRD